MEIAAASLYVRMLYNCDICQNSGTGLVHRAIPKKSFYIMLYFLKEFLLGEHCMLNLAIQFQNCLFRQHIIW